MITSVLKQKSTFHIPALGIYIRTPTYFGVISGLSFFFFFEFGFFPLIINLHYSLPPCLSLPLPLPLSFRYSKRGSFLLLLYIIHLFTNRFHPTYPFVPVQVVLLPFFFLAADLSELFIYFYFSLRIGCWVILSLLLFFFPLVDPSFMSLEFSFLFVRLCRGSGGQRKRSERTLIYRRRCLQVM